MIRNIVGAVVFSVGVAAIVAVLQIGDLLPRLPYEGQVRSALSDLQSHIDRQLDDAGGWVQIEQQGRLHVGLSGERITTALELPETYWHRFRHVEPRAVIVAEFVPGRQFYRLEYRGQIVTGEGLFRDFVALDSTGTWDDRKTRLQAEIRPWRPFLLGGSGVLIVVGLWLGLAGIYVRRLFVELLLASLAGIVVLTLLLFIGAALQFIDRHSYLGPEFFLQAIPMLLKQVAPYTIAFGALAGATMVFGRIANDREEIILQFNGVRLAVLLLPAAMVGAIFCGINFFAAHYWAPEGERDVDLVPFRAMRTLVDRLPTGSFAFGHDELPFALTYKNRTPEGFDGLTLMFFDPPGPNRPRFRPNTLFCARHGRITYSDTLGQVRFELTDVAVVRYENWPWQAYPKSFYAGYLLISQTMFGVELTGRKPARQASSDAAEIQPLTPRFGGLNARSVRIKSKDLFQLREYIEEREMLATAAAEQRRVRDAALDDQREEFVRIRQQQMELMRQAFVGDRERWERVEAKLTVIPNITAAEPLTPTQFAILARESTMPENIRQTLVAQLQPTMQRADEVRKRRIPGALKDEDFRWVIRQVPETETEFFRRWAITFTPILFMAIALPLGLLIRQGNLLVAFLVAVITVLLCWFVVMTFFEKLAKDMSWPWVFQQIDAGPWMAFAAPTVSTLIVALALSFMAFGTRWFLGSRAAGKSISTDDDDDGMGQKPAATRRTALDGTLANTAVIRHNGDDNDGRGAWQWSWWDFVLPWRLVGMISRGISRAIDDQPLLAMMRHRIRSGIRIVRTGIGNAIFGSPIDRYVWMATLVSLVSAFFTVLALFIAVDYLVNADFFKAIAERRQKEATAAVATETSSGTATTTTVAAAKRYTPLAAAISHYTARTPQMAYMLAPLVTLLALAFTLSRMLRANEFLVTQSSGISVWRVLRPMVILTTMMAAVMLVHHEWGAPYWAEQMRQEGSFMDRRDAVHHKVLTDTDGRGLWLQNYDVRAFSTDGLVLIDFSHGFPPQIAHATAVTYDPHTGWSAQQWRIQSVVPRHYDGMTVQLVEDIAVGGNPPGVPSPDLSPRSATPRPSFTDPFPLWMPENGGTPIIDDDDDDPFRPDAPSPLSPPSDPRQIPPASGERFLPDEWVISADGTVRTPLKPQDVNRRITQVLEDLSISELWALMQQRPDWNAPQVMLHRSFIYPLAPLTLFLIGAPLVLRAGRRSAWHGLSICVLLGIGFFAALISLSGWGLYTTDLSPALILWGGMAPFFAAGFLLFSRLANT